MRWVTRIELTKTGTDRNNIVALAGSCASSESDGIRAHRNRQGDVVGRAVAADLDAKHVRLPWCSLPPTDKRAQNPATYSVPLGQKLPPRNGRYGSLLRSWRTYAGALPIG